jgi:DnaJ-domain-containing protein 1
MAQANDSQMQQFANDRVRVRAEQCRNLINALRDDKAALDAVYDRAVNGKVWVDTRDDGPPKLLEAQDLLVFNAVASLLLACIDGTATAEDVKQLHENWPVFQCMCVRPVGSS